MRILIVYIFILLTSIKSKAIDGEILTTYYKDLYIGKYSDVGNIQILDVLVPPSTLNATLSILPKKKKSSCESFLFEIYLRYESFPVAQFDGNNTFSSDFLFNPNLTSYFQLNSYEKAIKHTILFPSYGVWFLAAFISRKDNQVIQNINSFGCSYSLQVNATIYTVPASFIETISQNTPVILQLINESVAIYKFYVEPYTMNVNINVSCVWSNCSNILLLSQSKSIPSLNSSSNIVNCTFISNCYLLIDNPINGAWLYISITHFTNLMKSTINIVLTTQSYKELPDFSISNFLNIGFRSSTSHSDTSLLSTDNLNINNSIFTNQISGVTDDFLKRSLLLKHVNIISSPTVISLNRLMNNDDTLATIFTSSLISADSIFLLFDVNILLVNFDLDQVRDVGSTLKVFGEISFSVMTESKSLQHVHICLEHDNVPINFYSMSSSCIKPTNLNKNLTSMMQLIPYPQAGSWYISVQYYCTDTLSNRVKCEQNMVLKLRVETMSCVDGNCKNEGNCRQYSKSIYTMAACTCIAGYRGFDCSDNSNAASDGIQILYTMLLCLSNLFFLPAIVVSFLRRRYVECLTYTANMFFSTFYHACDMFTWSKYKYCLMPYYVLSFCDFFCSLLSFWMTLIAMARLPAEPRSVLHIFGAIMLSMAIRWNVTGWLTNLIPIVIGISIVIFSWITRCYKRRQFFPSKKDYLWMIPGVLLAILGMCIFGFIENDLNYPYTHSAWHVCMSLCILFLLPRETQKYLDEKFSSLDIQLDEHSSENTLIVFN